ncbi:MAG: ABC transporter ATP-binding protein [Cytophagales bacterium]|nr:ABC transporter ATP-binding protein [Bernardetiaceae bacterium]MDW8205526.1 ABC transporter ATP-binding protein [Cytophagales bacterium]
MLSVEDLSITYPNASQPALQHICLEVNKGELVAIIGESGCGKTTLLRLIAGLEHPQTGSISINSKVVASQTVWIKPEKRKVGMVFQDYALFPHLNVAENVRFGLTEHKAQQNKRIAEVLELVGLTGYERRYPHQLSGGQQQRVAIARALAPRPELLLLDEPFSNLDEMLKDQVRDELFELLSHLGITTLFVTHDTRDTLATADRIAVLNNGLLQQYGKPQHLYYEPANEYVAVFLGKANILPVTDRATMLHSPIGSIPKPANVNFLVKNICIRPENILIFTDPQKGMSSGIIKRVRFFGSYCEYTIVGDGWQLVAKTQLVADIRESCKVGIQVNQYACLP